MAITAIAAAFFGERVTATKIAGFALASIGAALVIAAGQTGGELSSRRLFGDVLMLAGAVCWAIYTALGTITLRTRSPLEVVALAVRCCLSVSSNRAIATSRPGAPASGPTPSAWRSWSPLEASPSSIGWFGVSEREIASMSSYFVPVLTLAMAVVLLGDRPQLLQLVGGLVILAGVRLATLRPAREGQPMPEGAA